MAGTEAAIEADVIPARYLLGRKIFRPYGITEISRPIMTTTIRRVGADLCVCPVFVPPCFDVCPVSVCRHTPTSGRRRAATQGRPYVVALI